MQNIGIKGKFFLKVYWSN